MSKFIALLLPGVLLGFILSMIGANWIVCVASGVLFGYVYDDVLDIRESMRVLRDLAKKSRNGF